MNNRSHYQGTLPTDYRYYILPLILAVIISLLPWPDIILSGTRGVLIDREVYIQKIIYRDNLLNYFHFNSYVDYFTSEYSWWFLMKLLEDGRLPVNYETVFQIISTLFLVTSALIVYRRGGLLPLVFLANPLVFELAYSQLRSALAISILYLVYLFFRRSTYIAIALCLFAATIHTTMVIFLAIYILCIMTADEGDDARAQDEGKANFQRPARQTPAFVGGHDTQNVDRQKNRSRSVFLRRRSTRQWSFFWRSTFCVS